MHRLWSVLFLLSLAGSLLQANSIPGDNSPRLLFAPDRVKVQLTAEAIKMTNLPQELYARTSNFSIPELDKILTCLKASGVIRAHRKVTDSAWEQKTGFDRWFLVEIPGGTDIKAAINLFKSCCLIEQAEPEYLGYIKLVPDDTYYPNNWGHNNTMQLNQYNTATGLHDGPLVGLTGFDSNAQAAWDLPQGLGSSSIIIAIIDNGFDLSHPDLLYVTGYDFGCNDSNPGYQYNFFHGTAVAGIAAAKGNNGFGVAGIAGGCSIMPLKVTDWWGYMYLGYMANAVTYAVDHGADVISISLGWDISPGYSAGTDAAFNYAYQHGVPVFAAAGNDFNSNMCYPANHSDVIAVGAASPTGELKNPTSADGEPWGSSWGSNVQDAAGATDIIGPTILPTTDIMGPVGYDSGNYCMYFNGTSCATPYVAGVAALLKSRNPTLTPAQVRTALTSTAINMYWTGWDQWTGYGFVNAFAALGSVAGGIPYCHITSPSTNSGFDIGSTIIVNASAYDFDGSINRVEFYLDSSSTPAYTDYYYPYIWSWNTTGYSVNLHNIKARAFDNSGLSTYHAVAINLLNPATDDFESSFLTTLPWVQSGNADWTIQSDEAFSGTKAAKSGVLPSSPYTSTMAFSVYITSEGTFSFFRKIVSESGTDSLCFYIDNVLKAYWTGWDYWFGYTGTVTTGVHEFKWTFSSGGTSPHFGCAYLDHIILPSYTASTQPNIQWSPSSITESLPQNNIYYAFQYLYISNWNSPPTTFTAHLPYVATTVLDETFATTTLPTGWTRQIISGTANWQFGTGGYQGSHPSAAYDGQYNAKLVNPTTTAMTARLISPVIDLSDAVSATLSFWHTQEAWPTHGQDALGVYYRTSSTGSWILLESYTYSIANWTREVINLPNLSSTYYICFGGGVQYGYGVCLDKVMVTKQSGNATPWVRIEGSNFVTATIGPMSIYMYHVEFSSMIVSSGTYTSYITLTSNSYNNSTVIIPITFNVYDPAPPSAPTNLTIFKRHRMTRYCFPGQAPPDFQPGMMFTKPTSPIFLMEY
jgi:hypothetical protein